MAIYIGKNKQVSSIHIGSSNISYVYKYVDIVWQAIRSCFGSGFWVNGKPWLNIESWKNK